MGKPELSEQVKKSKIYIKFLFINQRNIYLIKIKYMFTIIVGDSIFLRYGKTSAIETGKKQF